jgi:hypothetical protein
MAESTEIQDYLVEYMPSLIGRFLAESPVPDMDGTSFTVQVTIEGKTPLTWGMTVDNGKDISVQPGGIENPVVSVKISEEIFRNITGMVAAFTSRKMYDEVTKAKGTLNIEMALPEDLMGVAVPAGTVLPVSITFNGADAPQGSINGPAEVLMKVLTGQVSGPQAFMQGDMKMDGDMMFLMSLANLVI